MRAAAIAALLAAGCVRDAVPARFADKPIVTASDDTRPIPEPKVRTYRSRMYLADALVFRPLWETLDPRAQVRAEDTNALDEVPDSTWFTNRIGVRDVTPDEAVNGSDSKGPPVGPFTITNAKKGGANPGFIAKDSRGVKYLVKFDTASNPGQQTATDAIVQRILWAAGYHTPVDFVVYFQRSELSISPKLAAKNGIDDRAVDRMLADAARGPDGSIRASVSQFLDGVPKNGWAHAGRRGDDPNDHVPHEHRRSVRGLRVFAAWLNHTDMKEDNTLDMYVGKPGQGHLEHYLVDFGEAFAGHQDENHQPQIGFEYAWDYSAQLKGLFSFGLWHRRWEAQRPTPWPQVGMFSATAFDPRRWRERYPYTPFSLADRVDHFWGAKIVMRFDRPLLEAIVQTGKLGNAAAERHVVDTLLARRDAIGRAYLDGVTPLDELAITDGRLCGVDLARRYGIATEGAVEYAGTRTPIAADGKVCVAVTTAPGYHVAKLAIRRHDHTTPALEVHYMGGIAPHVVGLIR